MVFFVHTVDQYALIFQIHGVLVHTVCSDILADPSSVLDERTKSRGAVAGPGSMRTAQISTCPMPSLVVYNENSYPTKMSAIS